MGTAWFKRRKSLLRFDPPLDPQRGESELLMRRFDRSVLREKRSLFLLRLIAMHVLFAALALAQLMTLPGNEEAPLLVWITLIMVAAVSFWVLSRAGNRRAIELTAGLSAVWVGTWLLPMVLLVDGHPLEIGMALVLWTIGVLSIPWQLPTVAGLGMVILGAAAAFADWGVLGGGVLLPTALWLATIAILVIAGIIASRASAMGAASRSAQQAVNEYCASASNSALVTVRLVALGTCAISDARRALIVIGSGVHELVEGATIQVPSVEGLFSKALVQRLLDLNLEVGRLSTRALGDQFTAPLHDWFGIKPRSLIFVRFMMVIDEREQPVFVIIPVTWAVRLSGVRSVMEALQGIRGLAQVSFAAARGRFLASDALLISQRAALERERELAELVHLVNNVAQDISMQCETIRQLTEDRLQPEKLTEFKTVLEQELSDLETTSRYLSAGVSDTTLVNELLRIRTFSRHEEVELEGALNDLRTFGDYRAKRRGLQCRIELQVESGVVVTVTSREFLDTCLRALLRESFSGSAAASEIRVGVSTDATQVRIEFDGYAPAKNLSKEAWPPALHATERFAALSGGELRVEAGEAPFSSRFCLVLQRGEATKPKARGRGRWALFVDDNPQVTAFYGRIAEAFSLPFHSAASVTEAMQIIENEGQPRFVMTDLQLGEETGLDLVSELRRRYGRELSVIVISGNVSEEVRSKVEEVGATKFLAKPVGRSRLVAEFQSLVGSV